MNRDATEFIRQIKGMLEDQYTCTDREMCEQLVDECTRFLRENRERQDGAE